MRLRICAAPLACYALLWGACGPAGGDALDAAEPADSSAMRVDAASLVSDGSVLDAEPADAGQQALPEHANAIELDGALHPLYATEVGGLTFHFVAGVEVEARVVERSAAVWVSARRWRRVTDAVEMTGGFDMDADGVMDLALVHASAVASCNASVVTDRYLEFVSGRTGETLGRWMTARDRCWVFPSTAYATTQWSVLGILFGQDARFVALQTQYETQGFVAAYDVKTASLSPQYAYVFPSTPQFATYAVAQPNAYGGTAWVDNSHVANGLVVTIGGEERVVLFTSARAAVYRAGPYDASQLLLDRPFVARPDLAGRNYGLVSLDPERPASVSLIAGTDTRTVFADRVSGARGADPWAGIERHVTVFDLGTGVLSQRFFSYAHDASDGHQYEGRVVYPAEPHVRVAEGSASRLAYSLFAAGRWSVHVSEPAAHADAVTFDDLFLWDVRDVDGDGQDEWLLSPAAATGDAYLPAWRTRIARWDEATRALVTLDEVDGIPELVTTFRTGTASTTRGGLEQVAVVLSESSARLALRRADGVRAYWP